VARRSGLGRGLGALIPGSSSEDSDASYQELPIGAIVPNQLQPRTQFDEEALAALTASIRELGVLQPILVRDRGGGSYELIAGERRWRAAKRAGLDFVPAIIRTVGDTASLEQAVVENIQREDLNAMDEAAAYKQLIEDFNLTHDELASRMGKSRAAISNALRLFQLPPSIQRLVMDGQLAAGHARAILTTPDRAFQEGLARRAVAENLSVRAVEQEARKHALVGAAPAAVTPRTAPPRPAVAAASGATGLRPPGLLELEELLAAFLDTRVTVEMGTAKGKVTVEFATLEDLERIYRKMTQPLLEAQAPGRETYPEP